MTPVRFAYFVRHPRPFRGALFCVLFVMAVISFGGPDRSINAQIQTDFIEVALELGIDINTKHENQWDTGSGAAFLDCDGDGDMDLYVAMGHGEANRMYLLDRETGTYEDFADALGCADAGSGKGVKFADYDNDGDPDLFIANLEGADRLYNNRGGGRYVDVTAQAGVGDEGLNHGAAWGDFNNDGWLDLYVCNRARGEPDLLWLNRKDGTFSNYANTAGITSITTPSCEVVWFDYDRDGDQDLYITVDGMNTANTFYRNNGNGRFTNVTVATGTEAYIDGMGIAVGDYDNDGWEDLYATHTGVVYGNPLFHNNGDGTFTDLAPALGTEGDRWGWGTEFMDYDNDGDLDLYVVNWGNVGGTGAGNQMFESRLANGGTNFVNSTTQAGVGDRGPGFGLAVGDYNDDGFVDMFIVNRDARSVFYENTLAGNGNNWLKVRTIGRMGRADEGVPRSNRDGIGARIVVSTAAGDQLRVIRSASGYLSMSSLEAEFGVGAANTIDRVEVTWPSGVVDVLDNVTPNTTLTVCEGGWPVEFSSVKADARKTGVDITWDLLCEGETTAFQIFRSRMSDAGFDPAVPVATVDASVRQWNDGVDVEAGVTYRYNVNAIGKSAVGVRSESVEVTTPSIARTLQLRQNAPNPFNPQTTIIYGVANAGRVRLSVYDVNGALVDVLVDRFVGEGEHEFVWQPGADGRTLSVGPYFYRLETPEGELTRKMILLR